MAVKSQRVVDPFASAIERRAAWRLGMWLFVVVVAMVFGAAILGYAVVRLGDGVGSEWKPKGAPGLPHLLLLSTAFVGLVSAAHELARRAASRGHRRAIGHWMTVALVAAIAFLVSQAVAWWQLVHDQLRIDQSLYGYTFFVLTGLHAIHVIGGLPSLWITARHAHAGRYGRANALGIEMSGLYWHALAVAWMALYATLWLGS